MIFPRAADAESTSDDKRAGGRGVGRGGRERGDQGRSLTTNLFARRPSPV